MARRAVALVAIILVGTLLAGSCDTPFKPTIAQKRPPSYWQTHPPDPAARLDALPAPAVAPTADLPQSAAALAKAVLAGDAGSLPALLAAIQASGIGVIELNGQALLQPAQPSQGIRFDHFEVITMARSPTHPIYEKLSDFGNGLALLIPGFKGNESDIAQGILDSIVQLAQSGTATDRFWALFVIELGRQDIYTYDMLPMTFPPDVTLDGIQTAFILRRVMGDVAFLTKTNRASPNPTAVVQSTLMSYPAADGGSPPCSLTETENLIVGIGGLALGVKFAKVWEKRNVKFVLVERLLAPLLALATVAAYFSLIRIDVNMPNGVLTRTDETQTDGEPQTLQANVHFDVGNFQLVNCLRILLIPFGADLSSPSDGALPGVKVEWDLLKGADYLHWKSADQGTFLSYPSVETTTNADGVAQATIEGTRQPVPVSKTMPRVRRPASVRVRAQMVPTTGSASDWVALAGLIFARSAGVVPYLITAVPEVLLRLKLAWSEPYDFKVIDRGLSLLLDADVSMAKFSEHWAVRDVPIEILAGSVHFGTGKVQVLDAGSWVYKGHTFHFCSSEPQVAGTPFIVTGFDLSTTSPPDVTLQFTVGEGDMTCQSGNPDSPVFYDPWTWDNTWSCAPEANRLGDSIVSGWEYVGQSGGVFARRVLLNNASCAWNGADDHVTITLTLRDNSSAAGQ